MTRSQITLQPKTTPAIDEDFTFGGKCTTTNGKTITGIISHSCFYDLCLGSPTDCISIYAGGRFNFSPIQGENSRAIFVKSQNNGFLDPESEAEPFGRKLQNQGSFDDVKIVPIGIDFVAQPLGSRAALPPSFPGFGFGGTGRYQGIKCNFDLITVAQRSFFPLVSTTESPTESPTLTDEPTGNKNNNRDLSQEDEQQEEENNRDLQRVDEDDDAFSNPRLNTGVIVQKIFFTCNQRLPLGPKAI